MNQLTQIFVIIFTFVTDDGVRHSEEIPRAFTTEHSCNVVAKRVMKTHHERIPNLYWWCEPVPLYGPQEERRHKNIHI